MSIRVFMLLVLLAAPGFVFAETVPTMASAQEDYQAGHFTQAAEKYQKIIDSLTDQTNPNSQNKDLIICQYNLARSLDKAGQFEKAKNAYMTVAGSTDNAMALRAKYDLGCLYAQIANQESGSDPKAADQSVREKIRSNVKLAEEQWRAVLAAQPDYPDAAEKLERILVVSSDWEKAWKNADLEKSAEKKTALEYAVDVENEILKTKSKIARLGLKEDSLVTRQEFFQTADQLSDTIKKTELLQDKTFKALSGQEAAAAQAQPGQPAPQASVLTPEQQAQLEQVKPVIEQIVKNTQSEIEKSAQELYKHNAQTAADAQDKAVQTLDNIYLSISPLQEMISRAIKEQKELIKFTEKKIKDNQNESKKEANKQKSDNKSEDSKSESDSEQDKTKNQSNIQSDNRLSQIELEENVFKQKMLLPWTESIAPKAEAMLQQLPPEKTPQSDDDNSMVKLKNNAENLQDALDALQNPDDAAVDPNSDNPQDQQTQKIRNMCKKAVELGPKIPPLVKSAAKDLKTSKLDDALTSQKEALRLLEEILKDDSQQNQDKQDQQNQDQQNQDKQNQDQQNQDQQSNNKQDQNKDQQNKDKQDQQDKQDQDKQDQNKQDQDKQDQQDQQDQDEQNESEQDKKSEEEEQKEQDEQQAQQDEQEAQQQEAQQKDEELTDAQARGLMRRVQARQEEKKKLEAKLRKLLNPPDKVEKDW